MKRVVALILAGGALAVSGLVMQQLTRNRFVAPSTAGTVDAAAVGVLVSLLLFASAPVMARPALWVVPMHSPASVAATQNTGAVTAA